MHFAIKRTEVVITWKESEVLMARRQQQPSEITE